MKIELEFKDEEELKKLYLILLFYQQYLWPKMYEQERDISKILHDNNQTDKATLSFLDYQRIELLIETEHNELCNKLREQLHPFVNYPLIDRQHYKKCIKNIKKEGE